MTGTAASARRSGSTADDVDLDGEWLLHPSAPSKQRSQREVPLHPSTSEALRAYARLRDRALHAAGCRSVLPGHEHRRRGFIDRTILPHVFDDLRCRAGDRAPLVTPAARGYMTCATRMSVRTLLGWYRAGDDVERKLPLLSTYLGHVASR